MGPVTELELVIVLVALGAAYGVIRFLLSVTRGDDHI